MQTGNILQSDEAPNLTNTRPILLILAVVFALFHIIALQFLVIDPIVLRNIFLAGTFILAFAYWKPPIKTAKWKGVDKALAVVIGASGIAASIYVAFQYREMAYRVGISPTHWDTFFGVLVLVGTLYVALRTLGIGLPVLAILAILYALFGQYLPGSFGHGGFHFERTVSIMYSSSGMFGIPISVALMYVLPFVIFGAFLEANGTGRYIMDLSLAITGRYRGGPAKIATVSSALFGSINGSPVANVMSTGVMTIPMMKRGGYKSSFAGAVEAVASTGGQLLPPVMGAAAFIMVELTGKSYSTIMLAALLPALLYYLFVFWVIDLQAGKTGLRGMPKDQLPVLWALLKERGYLLLPLIILVVCLVGLHYSPLRSALIGIISAIVIPAIRKETRMSLGQIIGAIESGAKNTVPVAAATAAAGIIVGIMGMTGIGHQFASIILGLANGMLFPSLLLTAFVALVLGVGMPTTGAYIITASVLPTTLIPLGVDLLAAHLFLLYFANISNLTPPVALASYAAAGIAESSPTKVGSEAFLLGIVGFIIPFLFVYRPELLLQSGGAWDTVFTIAVAAIAVLSLGIAYQGWFRVVLPAWLRMMMLAAACTLILPGVVTDTVGLALAGLSFGYLLWSTRNLDKGRQPG